jgi:hypothetical protein
LYGERLDDFRCRLLRPLQKHSKIYAKSDLASIRDPAAFAEAERTVIADSVAQSSSADSVPAGQLRPIVRKLPSGHTSVTWVGQPQAWMDQFAGTRRYCTAIRTKFKSE